MMETKEIMQILPHAFPFLLVDRVIEIEVPRRIVGLKSITYNEAFFPGHFPGDPLMPGVLIIEAMAQTAGILAYKSMGEEAEGKGVYLMALREAKFRRPVLPGDQLLLEMETVKRRGNIWVFRGKAKANGQIVAEAEIMAMIRENKPKSPKVHPTAIVHPSCELAEGVEIGPYSIIGEDVKIGENTWIGSHVVIDQGTVIGKNCQIFHHASIGTPPQHIRYQGEKTRVIIGDNSVIREFVTIHRGTSFGGGLTKVGNSNFIMAYAHVAHDCQLGDFVIMANAAQLAGHVTVGDHAIIGGVAAVHQFVRIGKFAFIGGATAVPKDIPPYVTASGIRAKLYGINVTNLKRNGFSDEVIRALRKAYKILFRSSKPLKGCIEEIKNSELFAYPEVKDLVEFLEGSKRGITR